MQQPNHHSLSSLYPQARKCQYDLKMQISYLDTGRTGGLSDEELQSEARANLNTLQQLLWQLDSLVQVHPNAAEKETWVKKLQQLRFETQGLGSTLEQHIFRVSRRNVEMRERESLLSRRNAGWDSANGAMHAAQESESLRRSTQMVNDLNSMSTSILGDLASQRQRMKSARTKVLDIANRLGLSSSLLRVIERRDTVDAWIVFGGMVLTLLFLYACVAWFRS